VSASRALFGRSHLLKLVVPLTVALAGVAALVAPGAGAGVPPPTTTTTSTTTPTATSASDSETSQCARFAVMQDEFSAINEQQTIRKVFTAIDRAMRAFRLAARRAPDAIASDMDLLAESLAELDDSLQPFRTRLHSSPNNAEKYADMIDSVYEAFEKWTKGQDVDELNTAQTHVQKWLSTNCGFALGSGEDSESDGGATSCTSAEGAAATVIESWKADDRDAARGCATDAVLTEVFGFPQSVQMDFMGCEGVDSTTADCTYRYEGGSLTMTVSGAEGTWRVTGITGHPD
jgi:hypothetical protein